MPACRRAAWAGCTKSPPVTSSRTLVLLGDGQTPTERSPLWERIKPGGSENSGPPGFFLSCTQKLFPSFPKRTNSNSCVARATACAVGCLAPLPGFGYSGVLRWRWEHLNVVSADARRDAFLEFVN